MKCQACDTANDDDARFCKACAKPLDRGGDDPRAKEIRRLRAALEKLATRVEALEQAQPEDPDAVRALVRRLDSSKVFSPDFVPRAVAIWAHAMAVGLLFGLVAFVIAQGVK